MVVAVLSLLCSELSRPVERTPELSPEVDGVAVPALDPCFFFFFSLISGSFQLNNGDDRFFFSRDESAGGVGSAPA